MANKYDYMLSDGSTMTLEGDRKPTPQEVFSAAQAEGLKVTDLVKFKELAAEQNAQLAAKSAQPTAEEKRLNKQSLDRLDNKVFAEGSPLLGALRLYDQAGRGTIERGGERLGKGEYYGGASDIVRGSAAMAAPALLPPALVTAPVATAVGLAATPVAGAITGELAHVAGATPEQVELAETLGGFAGGGAAGYGASKIPVRSLLGRAAANTAKAGGEAKTLTGQAVGQIAEAVSSRANAPTAAGYETSGQTALRLSRENPQARTTPSVPGGVTSRTPYSADPRIPRGGGPPEVSANAGGRLVAPADDVLAPLQEPLPPELPPSVSLPPEPTMTPSGTRGSPGFEDPLTVISSGNPGVGAVNQPLPVRVGPEARTGGPGPTPPPAPVVPPQAPPRAPVAPVEPPPMGPAGPNQPDMPLAPGEGVFGGYAGPERRASGSVFGGAERRTPQSAWEDVLMGLEEEPGPLLRAGREGQTRWAEQRRDLRAAQEAAEAPAPSPEVSTSPIEASVGEAVPAPKVPDSAAALMASETFQRAQRPLSKPSQTVATGRAFRSSEAQGVMGELKQLDVADLQALLEGPETAPQLLPLIRKVLRARGQ